MKFRKRALPNGGSKPTQQSRAIFLGWNRSRRSETLAGQLDIPLRVIQPEMHPLFRFTACAIWTFVQIIRYRPERVILQYSFLLLLILALYKTLISHNFRIVCDCHTKALRRSVHGVTSRFFWFLKRWSFQKCDLCLIHNDQLISEIEALNTNYLIVSDPIPWSHANTTSSLVKGRHRVVFVCSYDRDEPVMEMIAASRELMQIADIFFTGRFPENLRSLIAGDAIYITDYLSDSKYFDLISSACVVVGLTTEEGCLQCSAFEALATGKPIVTSDKKTLRAALGDAAVYVQNDSRSIAEGVKYALKNLEYYEKCVRERAEIVDKLASEDIQKTKSHFYAG